MQPHPCDILPLQLLKFVWNFDFQAAAKLADDIMSKVINETVADTEIIAV